MEDNKLTEFEEKLIEIVIKNCDFIGPELIADLRQIMPPTCTPNERKFLDEMGEKGKLIPEAEYEDEYIQIGWTEIYQEDFESKVAQAFEKNPPLTEPHLGMIDLEAFSKLQNENMDLRQEIVKLSNMFWDEVKASLLWKQKYETSYNELRALKMSAK